MEHENVSIRVGRNAGALTKLKARRETRPALDLFVAVRRRAGTQEKQQCRSRDLHHDRFSGKRV
jgi:hypothetical protein